MLIKVGTKLKSQVGTTELVVIRAPASEIEVKCGGWPMITSDQTPQDGLTVDPTVAEQTLIGKRYTDPDDVVEVLVTKPGAGPLALGDTPLAVKQAKPLPASD